MNKDFFATLNGEKNLLNNVQQNGTCEYARMAVAQIIV